MPSQSMDSGIQLNAGSGRIIEMMGFNVARTVGLTPMTSPKGTPASTLRKKPVNTRDALTRGHDYT